MSFKLVFAYYSGSPFTILEIDSPGGINTRDVSFSRVFDEANSMQNILVIGRRLQKRAGSAYLGSAQTGSKVAGLGFLEQDSGITPLMTVNQTLYKYVSSAWAASDKTNYTANLDTSIQSFSSKSGNSLDSGTTTSGSTNYYLEDTAKTWTPGAHKGHCVVIAGEVKYISDNTATLLFLGDKLNSDTNSDYQGKAYNIYAVSPFAFIGNGTDNVQKYDLTTTTPIDGTQVTSGVALPLASWLSTHQGRLVISNAVGNSNDRIFLSDGGIGENITTDTNLNVNTQVLNDGDQINVHGSLPLETGSVLLIAKDNSLHAMEGDTVLNYTVRKVTNAFGFVSPKSMQIFGQLAFGLSFKGVMSISNVNTELLKDPLPVSLPIQDQLDALTKTQLRAATSAVYKNRYYLQAGSKLWYYDMEASIRQAQHVWSDLSYPFNFNQLQVIDGVLYGGDSASGQVYQLETGTQDAGSVNVTMVYESGEIALSDLKALDRRIGGMPVMWVERVEFYAQKDSATILRLQTATDGGAYGSVQSLTANRDDQRYSFNVQQKCYSFKFKLTETGSNTPVALMLPIRVIFNTSEFGDAGSKG